MVCASRCTDAIPSARGTSRFAAVEGGKHHPHAAAWCTPVLLCPSLSRSHLTLQHVFWMEFRCFSFQSCLYRMSPILTSVERWNILFSRFSEQLLQEDDEAGCWDVVRVKKLSWLNGELCLITAVIYLSMPRQSLSLEETQCPVWYFYSLYKIRRNSLNSSNLASCSFHSAHSDVCI